MKSERIKQAGKDYKGHSSEHWRTYIMDLVNNENPNEMGNNSRKIIENLMMYKNNNLELSREGYNAIANNWGKIVKNSNYDESWTKPLESYLLNERSRMKSETQRAKTISRQESINNSRSIMENLIEGSNQEKKLTRSAYEKIDNGWNRIVSDVLNTNLGEKDIQKAESYLSKESARMDYEAWYDPSTPQEKVKPKKNILRFPRFKFPRFRKQKAAA